MPTFVADDEGIWGVNLGSQKQYGIRWEEIYRITGYKLDGITETYTVIEIDFDWGEFIEINQIFPGFSEIVAAISRKVPGIRSDWFQTVETLRPEDKTITIWQRA